MKNLLLIHPVRHDLGWVRYFQVPPLALLQVGAATPPTWSVTMADETLDDIPFGERSDLVGITCMTHQAPRAYEVADRFRESGVPVVLGGIHPTVLPEEALGHADAVVVGEAEPVWADVCRDAERGTLGGIYTAPIPEDLTLRIPPGRRELLDGKRYLTRNNLQTTRGCPYDCPFCTVTPYFGRKFRHRPVRETLEEIARLRGDFLLFLDDDVFASRDHALRLLRGLLPFEKKWASQATLKVVQDEELLSLARRSGCIGLFLGIESVKRPEGGDLPKHRQVGDMAVAVRRIQDEGILVEGSFIFGLEDDDEGVFERTVRFVEDNHLSNATFHLLTPYPGTRLFAEYKEQGRLLHEDWVRYNHDEVVYLPKRMTPERLYKGWVEARQAVYSWPSIFRRVAANPHQRIRNLAYNVLRKSPNDRLDPDTPPEDGICI